MSLTLGLSLGITNQLGGGGGGSSFSPVTYQAETEAIATAMPGMSTRRKKSYDRAVVRIKNQAGSAWSKIVGLYIIADSEANWLVNLKSPGTFNLTKTGTPTFAANDGVTTAAATSYYDTNIPLSALPQNDFSVGIYSKTTTGTTSTDFGAQNGSAIGITINCRDNTNKFVARLMSGTFTSTVTTFWNGEGWHDITRTGASAVSIGHHGIGVESSTTASVNPSSSLTLRILGAAGNAGFSARKLSGVYVCNQALTSDERKNLCAILRDLLDKITYGDIDITPAGKGSPTVSADVIAFGSSMANICAAYEAKRQGRSVVIIADWLTETDWGLGGMVTNGLGWIDAQDATTVSGIFREALKWINTVYYARADTTSQTGLSAESKAWQQSVRRMLDPTRSTGTLPGMDIPVYLSGGLSSVQMASKRITSITTADGRVFSGRVVIGADYDGQIVPKAGIPYIIGAEAKGSGGETYNGWGGANRINMPFSTRLSPYVIDGNAGSGLLPDVIPMPSLTQDGPDPALQSINFRLNLSTTLGRYAPFSNSVPSNYNALRYELAGRAYALNPTVRLVSSDDVFLQDPLTTANITWDINNGLQGLSTDKPQSGLDYGQATTDAQRRTVINDIRDLQKGFFYWHLYSGDARIPAALLTDFQAYYLEPTTFLDPSSDGELFWPNRPYLRDPTYRMKNAGFVLDGNDTAATDGTTPRSIKTVSCGSYFGDVHSPRRVAYDDGGGMAVYFAGGVHDTSQGGANHRSPIPMEVIMPDASVCTNFLTPTAPSVTRSAWSVIRMEPCISLLGQSCGMIAAMACEGDIDVQSVDPAAFRTRMLATPDSVLPVLPQVN